MKNNLGKRIVWLLVILLGLFTHDILGIKNHTEDIENKKINQLKKKTSGSIFSPVIYYLPETRFAFGAVGTVFFRDGKAEDNGKQCRPSSISPIFIYTQNKQFRAQLSADMYFKKEDYHLVTDIKYEKFPNKFFGIGKESPGHYEEMYTPFIFDISITFLRKIRKYINIGLRYHLSSYKIEEVEPGKLLDQGDIPGSAGSFLSGLGVQVEMDSRDNIFFPRHGNLFKFRASFYNKIIGSEFNYQNYRLDLRKYFPLFSSHVLAVQSIVQTQTGTVPFQRLSKLGGQFVMRGFYEGQYRDRNLVVMQAEYRMPLFWRLGIVGFGGIADVAHRFRDFKLTDLKTSYGFGIRYLFNKSENMWVRFDVGFGNGSTAFYFSVFEAF